MEQTAFQAQFDSLIEKYSELLVGEVTPATIELIRVYSLFTHINKTMPALAKHWLASNPEAKKELQNVFDEVKRMNEDLRASKGQE